MKKIFMKKKGYMMVVSIILLTIVSVKYMVEIKKFDWFTSVLVLSLIGIMWNSYRKFNEEEYLIDDWFLNLDLEKKKELFKGDK